MRTAFACFCLIANLGQPAESFADDEAPDPPAKTEREAEETPQVAAPTPAMLVHAREMMQARQRMARLARRKWGRTAAPSDYFSNEDYVGYLYTGYQPPKVYPAYGPFPLYGAATNAEERRWTATGR